MRYPLGEFAPDAADIGADVLDIARNVWPGPKSWKPWPSLESIAAALPAACKGFVAVQRTDGSFDTYAGTRTKLYKYDSATATFLEVTRLAGGDYAVPEGDYWCFIRFGNKLIAVNGFDAPQVIDVDVGTNFAALGGSPPVARFATVMADRVILSGLFSDPYAIVWSDVNDCEDWTPGGGSLAGNQPFANIGVIQGVFPSAGIVMGDLGMRAIIATGGPDSFQFPENIISKGTVSPYAVVEIGGFILWPSDDDFYSGNSQGITGLSKGRIFEYFRDLLDNDKRSQIYGAFDPFGTRANWAFSTSGAANDVNDWIIGIDWQLDRWFESDLETEVLGRLATAGTTLAGIEALGYLTLATVPAPFGSKIWMGGAPFFAAMTSAHLLASFSGAPMQALFQTGTYEFNEGRKTRLHSMRAVIEGAAAATTTLKVAKRSNLDETITFGAAISRQVSGRYKLNHKARFHTFEWTIPALAWKHAQGFEPRMVASSGR